MPRKHCLYYCTGAACAVSHKESNEHPSEPNEKPLLELVRLGRPPDSAYAKPIGASSGKSAYGQVTDVRFIEWKSPSLLIRAKARQGYISAKSTTRQSGYNSRK